MTPSNLRLPSLVAAFVLGAVWTVAIPSSAGADDWESAIAGFEEDDRTHEHPDDAIVFLGSSSIRLWETLAKDMHPLSVVNRGFGGATTADVVRYADRILGGRPFRGVVLFVANDIRGKPDSDKTPAEAAALFAEVVDRIRVHQPRAFVLLVAVTPTESRWTVWPQIQELNHRLAAVADARTDTVFVPTADLFLAANGLPQPELFRPDRLHLSAAGYALWTTRIRSYLDPLTSSR
jgi:lysophospholipase L1-like esterase